MLLLMVAADYGGDFMVMLSHKEVIGSKGQSTTFSLTSSRHIWYEEAEAVTAKQSHKKLRERQKIRGIFLGKIESSQESPIAHHAQCAIFEAATNGREKRWP